MLNNNNNNIDIKSIIALSGPHALQFSGAQQLRIVMARRAPEGGPGHIGRGRVLLGMSEIITKKTTHTHRPANVPKELGAYLQQQGMTIVNYREMAPWQLSRHDAVAWAIVNTTNVCELVDQEAIK